MQPLLGCSPHWGWCIQSSPQGTGPTGGCSRGTLHWGGHPSGPGRLPSGVSTAGPAVLGPPHNGLPGFEPFSKGFSQGPWGQLVALGDRCAILPDVLSLSLCWACTEGKSWDLPVWKCSSLYELLCWALLIPQVGQSSLVWSCCGFIDLNSSCLKKHFGFLCVV